MASSTTKWIIGLTFGLIGCIILAGYLWWHSVGAAIFQNAASGMMEGRRVGRTITASVCVDSGIARQSAAVAVLRAKPDSAKPDVGALMSPTLFLQGCLMVSQPSPEMCRNVPPRTDRQRTGQWAAEECQRRKVEDRSCPAMMLGVQVYCEQKARMLG